MTKKKTTAGKPKRRSPITRQEGEQRLINATLELLRERPFSEVGVRDIAERADVNHGFVHTWFGSKNDLLKRVAHGLFVQLADKVENAPSGQPALLPFDPDVNLLVRLVTWLKLENADISDLLKDRHVTTAFAHRYEQIEGMRPDVAQTAAQQIVAMGMATAAYGEIIDVNSNADLVAFMDQWRHIVGLLAKYPPA